MQLLKTVKSVNIHNCAILEYKQVLQKKGRQYLNDFPEKFNKTGDEEIT